MKKFLSVLLSLLLAAALLTSCCGNLPAESEKLSIVTTIFPEYDWVVNVLGDRASEVNLTLLLDSGVDLHSYQPTADDIIQISRCDLFIYVGGESDAWVEDTLQEASNKNMVVLNLLDLLGDAAREEEIKEGMEAEEEDEEEPEYDEHVWLSLKNAAFLTQEIADALSGLDEENGELYRANASAYIEKLNVLDARYAAAAAGAANKTLLFGDRFPFLYLVEDYGLDYFAAFAGCSAESEASFETVAFLAGKVDELHLNAVLTLEGSNHKIAETVVAASRDKSARILSMDSMQSTTSNDIKEGANYLSIMEKNLFVLTDALQ